MSLAPTPTPMRERVVAAALELTVGVGWARVTMAGIADLVGVSRQTVYNEMGTKAGLAEAMIHRELERFLAEVSAAFDRHPGDLVAAIRDASHTVLVLAHDNPLLHAVVSATHGADTELLPLLTTHAGSLLETAKAVLADRVGRHLAEVDSVRLDALTDVVARVVLSHVMAPSGSPARTADDIAWLTERVLLAHP